MPDRRGCACRGSWRHVPASTPSDYFFSSHSANDLSRTVWFRVRHPRLNVQICSKRLRFPSCLTGVWQGASTGPPAPRVPRGPPACSARKQPNGHSIPGWSGARLRVENRQEHRTSRLCGSPTGRSAGGCTAFGKVLYFGPCPTARAWLVTAERTGFLGAGRASAQCCVLGPLRACPLRTPRSVAGGSPLRWEAPAD